MEKHIWLCDKEKMLNGYIYSLDRRTGQLCYDEYIRSTLGGLISGVNGCRLPVTLGTARTQHHVV